MATAGTNEIAGAQTAPKRWPVWVGRVLSALPVLLMVMSGSMKLMRQPMVVQSFAGQFGYPEGTLLPIGIVELLCAVIYVVPQTAVLGAILITGYLGGATATHVRIGQPFVAPLALGVLA